MVWIGLLACTGGDGKGKGSGLFGGDDSGDSSAVTDDSEWQGYPELGNGVLWLELGGNLRSDSGSYLIDGIDELEQVVKKHGSEVTLVTEWPEDPTPYSVAIWTLPGSDNDGKEGQVEQALLDELDIWISQRGGRLVMAGDYNGSYNGYDIRAGNDQIDQIAKDWGLSMAINQTLPGEKNCNPDSSHPLYPSQGVSWYASESLSVADPAVWLDCSSLAVQEMGCGDVVVMGDVNPISDGAERADAFIKELIQEPLRACE